jgi:glutamate mutase epsilon subunit
MNRIAEDYAAINARLEEIKRERLQAPAEYEMQTAVDQYLGGEPAKEAANHTYMGWDIYAPVNVSVGFNTTIVTHDDGTETRSQ